MDNTLSDIYYIQSLKYVHCYIITYFITYFITPPSDRRPKSEEDDGTVEPEKPDLTHVRTYRQTLLVF